MKMREKHEDIDIWKGIEDQRNEVTEGLLYTHARINSNTAKTLEVSSFLYALIELLDEKGLLTIEELDERKKQVAERLVKKFVESGIGLLYQDPEEDKYEFEHEAFVDCGSRLNVCEAICCKLPFALSRQDVREGIIRWEFSRPYLIAHGVDGYCVHLDRNSYQCTVRNNRPVPCRGFGCQDDIRWKVWADYEKQLLNNEMIEQIEKSNEKIYACLEIKTNG
jgi:Fe-S-cluster containining protein